MLVEVIDASATERRSPARTASSRSPIGSWRTRFGYDRDELPGRSIDSLAPGGLRGAHARHRAEYMRAPVARPMAARQRLIGLRKDGATLPIRVTLSPVATATGHLTLAVVRDAVRASHDEDLAELVRSAAARGQEDRTQELLDRRSGAAAR
jgi:PAS domain S-box-containing protein